MSNKVYSSFEELDRDIRIAGLKQSIAEERFRGGLHLIREQFQFRSLKSGTEDILRKFVLPWAIQWGIKKLRKG
jgi:hypothetical protein